MTRPELDPRSGLVFAVLFSVALVLAPPVRALALGLPMLAVALVVVGRSGSGALIRTLVILWAATLAANAFLIPGDRLGPDGLGFLRPTTEGLRAGMIQGARLAGLTAVGAWAIRVIPALDLAAALEWTVRGVAPLRRHVHRLVFPILLAVRLVPLLVEETVRLRAVGRLRGEPRRGVQRVAAWVPVWMTAVIDRADRLALALRLRGYRPERPLSFSRGFRYGGMDWALTVLGLVAVAWGAA